MTSAQGGAIQPYLSQPLPCTHFADLISFHSMQESLEIKKYRARAVMPKHQLGRDTRGPSAPKHELRTPPCEEKLLRPLPSTWHGKKQIRGEERQGNVLMSSFLPPFTWAADSDFMSERLALVSRFIKLPVVLCPKVSGLMIL